MSKSKIIKAQVSNETSMEIALNRLLVIASYLDNDDLDVDTSYKTLAEVSAINRVVNNYIFVDNSMEVEDKNEINRIKMN